MKKGEDLFKRLKHIKNNKRVLNQRMNKEDNLYKPLYFKYTKSKNEQKDILRVRCEESLKRSTSLKNQFVELEYEEEFLSIS